MANLFSSNKLMFLTALLILSAIGLHTIVFNHEHPRFMGNEMTAAFHNENKKWIVFAVVLAAFLYVTDMVQSLLGRASGQIEYLFEKYRGNSGVLRSYSFLFAQLSSGLLHPLVH